MASQNFIAKLHQNALDVLDLLCKISNKHIDYPVQMIPTVKVWIVENTCNAWARQLIEFVHEFPLTYDLAADIWLVSTQQAMMRVNWLVGRSALRATSTGKFVPGNEWPFLPNCKEM